MTKPNRKAPVPQRSRDYGIDEAELRRLLVEEVLVGAVHLGAGANPDSWRRGRGFGLLRLHSLTKPNRPLPGSRYPRDPGNPDGLVILSADETVEQVTLRSLAPYRIRGKDPNLVLLANEPGWPRKLKDSTQPYKLTPEAARRKFFGPRRGE